MTLQGSGMAMASEAPCPMEAELAAMVLAGELDASDLPDCCNDMETWAETGRLCEPGLDGAGVVTLAPAPSIESVGVPSTSERVAPAPEATRSAPPGAPWRPPTGA
jgi:hypothetical protein